MKKQSEGKNFKKMRPSTLGFTLAELLMVVVILGILSAVALPQFAPQKEKAYVAEAVGILGSIRQLEEAYKLENGTYCDPVNGGGNFSCTSGWAGLGMTASPDASTIFWNYTVTAAQATFTATATRTSTRWSGSGAYPSTAPTVTLNETGTYAGTHPNKPV